MNSTIAEGYDNAVAELGREGTEAGLGGVATPDGYSCPHPGSGGGPHVVTRERAAS